MQNYDIRRISKCLKILRNAYLRADFNSLLIIIKRSVLFSLFLLSFFRSFFSSFLLILLSSLELTLLLFIYFVWLIMIYCKVSRHVTQAFFTTSHFFTAKNHVSARDYYNRRYKEINKKRQFTTYYENFTKSHINRIKYL